MKVVRVGGILALAAALALGTGSSAAHAAEANPYCVVTTEGEQCVEIRFDYGERCVFLYGDFVEGVVCVPPSPSA